MRLDFITIKMACVFWGVRLWHYLLGQVPIKKLQQLRLGYHLSLNIDSYLGKWLPSIFIVWSMFRSQNCRNCAQIIKLSWNIVWGKWQPLISPIFWVCIIHRTCWFFSSFFGQLWGYVHVLYTSAYCRWYFTVMLFIYTTSWFIKHKLSPPSLYLYNWVAVKFIPERMWSLQPGHYQIYKINKS